MDTRAVDSSRGSNMELDRLTRRSFGRPLSTLCVLAIVGDHIKGEARHRRTRIS